MDHQIHKRLYEFRLSEKTKRRRRTAGPSNGERVQAMRALLQRGDPASERPAHTFSAEEPGREDLDSTTPMAWNPTLPPDDAQEWHFRRRDRNGAPTTSHGHITLF